MKLPVYLYGHPVLRKDCVPAVPGKEDFKQLAADMFETMYFSEGVGLAAPQIGKNIQMLVVDPDELKDDFPECEGRKMVIINPEYEILEGKPISRPEGCLSLPGLSENVPRVENIHIKYLDEDFNEHEEVMTGFLARVVLHELDHLEGGLYIDKISSLRKQLIRGKLNNIVKGKTRTNYPAKYAPKR